MAKNRTANEITAAKKIKAKMEQAESHVRLSTKALSQTKAEISSSITAFYMQLGNKGVVEFVDAYRYLTKAERLDYANQLRSINKELKQLFSDRKVKEIFAAYSSARTNYDALRNIINLNSIKASGSLIKLYDEKYGKIQHITGSEFSLKDINERIYALSGNLANTVNQSLLQSMALKSEAKAVLAGLKEGIDRTDKGYARIVRTETNRIINAQELEYYREELGNDGYVMVSAILDGHTCPFCKDMDGKEIQIKNAKLGENIPPFHPNDRCIIVAAFGSEISDKEKILENTDKNFIQEVKRLYKKARNGSGFQKVDIPIRTVSAAEAAKIKAATGLNLLGYKHKLTGMDVRHIYKQHGNAIKEASRGQIAVTETDIALIPAITRDYDKIWLSPELARDGSKVLIYEKTIGNKYFYLEAIGEGGVLKPKTMYIKK
jgi:phage putative head morphogenesis protein, SPP1 gp7 family